jgi:HD-GYP domain-containing protein (c-di-GMP phosphodiesterase class II)
MHGRPLLVKDVSKDRRFQKGADKKSGFKTRDMVCVPVRVKGQILAVLQAINNKGGGFEKEDQRLFQMFSNQVAIAIDNARLYGEIRETFYATSKALAESIEKRDPYTGGHTKRVLEYSVAIGEELGMSTNQLDKLKLSAVLHDVGKIGVDDAILRKQAPLNDEEFAMMKKHPAMGADIMNHVPQLKNIIPGMLYHHERPDGRGYPKGLKGRKIPLIARIISAADTYDAMTTTRPYRKGLPKEVALAELRKYSGTQFDRTVVKAFINAFKNERIDEGLYLQAQSGGPGG